MQMIRAFALLALASVSPPSIAQKVRIDYDHGRDFLSYRTYRWVMPNEPPGDDAAFPNQLMRKRIVRFVDQVLAAKHLKRVEANPDLLVDYNMIVSQLPQYTTYSDTIGDGGPWGGWGCCGWAWGWGSGYSQTTVHIVSSGLLIVSMTDARHKQLVFEGSSTATISSRAGKNVKKLQKGINEIFEKFPPTN